MINLSSFVQFHAIRAPERTAVIYDGQHITYADLNDRTRRLAGWLQAQGVGADTVVAVLMKNSAAFLELAIATSYLGGVFLPVNYRLAADEVAFIQKDSEAHLLLADSEFSHVADLPNVHFLNEELQRDSRMLAGGDLTIPPPRFRRPQDLFRLMYTSGTTDRPKGVMHTYDNFYWKCMDHVVALALSGDDRLLVVGPLYHVGAFDLPGLAVLWVGGMMYVHRDFDPEAALASIEKEKLTGAWMAPAMLNAVLSAPGRERFNLGSMKWCIAGGEKTPEARIRALATLFPSGRFVDAYGLTESCSGDTLMESGRELEKIGSVGRALAHVQVEIRDEQGNPLAANAEGEICLRGPKITKGYWRDAEKTKATFFPEDWFRTGDVGYLDEDGFLYLTDRKKDLIISGGENIASSEVERVLYELPEIHEAAVIGLPDERWGERPVAVVVIRDGESLDYETLRRHCRQHLAGFKVPKQMFVRAELPRNPSGKVLKRVLRDDYATESRTKGETS